MSQCAKYLLQDLACLALCVGCSTCTSERGREDHGAQASSAESGEKHSEHLGHTLSATPTGYASISIDSKKMRAFGLATAKVEHRQLIRTLRTVGIVALDETRTAHVHARIRGFIESVSANFTGKVVKRGEALCGIFSQEVLAAQLELISLIKQKQELENSAGVPLANADPSWNTLIEGTRRRLLLWNVPAAMVERVERTQKPQRTYTISAPRAGVIIAKRAFAGAFVEASTELYLISDLTNLWVVLDVYEADSPYVKLGDSAKLTIQGAGDEIRGTVSYLAPIIDETTRTLKTRIDLNNSEGKLRPGSFVNAELSLMVGHGLAVPESAVILTGKRNIVFVVHGEHIQPREVLLGPLVEGFYRVDKGLEAEELVATGAQFLIDSESRLRAAGSPGGAHAGH